MSTIATTTDEIEIDLRDGDDPIVLAPAAAAAPVEATPITGSERAERRRARARRRIASSAVTVVAWVLTLGLLAVLFLPTALGYSRYAIVGGSMQGTHDKYSVVYAKPVPVEDLAVGDVITYVPPPVSGIDTLVTHRIIGIEEAEDGRPLFETKGDANEAADPWKFTLDQPVQNVVRFSIPWIGWGLIKLADPDVRQLAIGIPAGFIALGAVAELVGLTGRRRRPTATTA